MEVRMVKEWKKKHAEYVSGGEDEWFVDHKGEQRHEYSMVCGLLEHWRGWSAFMKGCLAPL